MSDLRYVTRWAEECADTFSGQSECEAAAADLFAVADTKIASLEAEIERLDMLGHDDDIHACDSCDANTNDCTESDDGDAMICRACNLEAENERLREALRCAEVAMTGVGVPHQGERDLLQRGVDCVRAAMANKPHEFLSEPVLADNKEQG